MGHFEVWVERLRGERRESSRRESRSASKEVEQLGCVRSEGTRRRRRCRQVVSDIAKEKGTQPSTLDEQASDRSLERSCKD